MELAKKQLKGTNDTKTKIISWPQIHKSFPHRTESSCMTKYFKMLSNDYSPEYLEKIKNLHEIKEENLTGLIYIYIYI